MTYELQTADHVELETEWRKAVGWQPPDHPRPELRAWLDVSTSFAKQASWSVHHGDVDSARRFAAMHAYADARVDELARAAATRDHE